MTPSDTVSPMAGNAVEVGAARRIDAPYLARTGRIMERVLLTIAAIFFALHFVHLKADFPNHSPWMDWSKYTDEGWYGDAAIRHYQLGHWNVPGDFNPAAALPVWPALELMLFKITGVSLVAARALTVTVFGLIVVSSCRLVRRWPGSLGIAMDGAVDRFGGPGMAASIGTLLLAVN
ncbi:MAG TPA: hypothetical protein VGU23_07930, partial [Acidobacteriaceae bacterium]|nr:hypothetical protein [Acidobacteriaceae bacterium]